MGPFHTGKTSFRGGYGIFFDLPALGQFEGGTTTNPPFVQTVAISNTSLNDPAGTVPDLNLSPQERNRRRSHPFRPGAQRPRSADYPAWFEVTLLEKATDACC
jgi:hypothetical protein